MRVFARDGFEGASMRSIAQEAGMRASSLYSHFKGKDDLFLHLISLAFEEENTYLNTWFSDSNPSNSQERIFAYIRALAHHFEENDSARFLLSFKFFPPYKHRLAIDSAIRLHERQVLASLETAYRNVGTGKLSPQDFSETTLALIDSLECELVFGLQNRFSQRCKSAEAMLELVFDGK